LVVRQAPLKKFLTKTLAAAIVGFLIMIVGATGILEGYFTKNQERFQTAATRALALRENQQQWISRLVTLQTQQQWAQAITEKTIPSLEGPFLSYLGNVIPPQMILYKTVVKRTKDMWDLELAGRTSTNLSSTLLLIDELARELAQGPYHVRVQEGWREQLLNQTNSQAVREDTPPHYQWTLKGNLS
jgi:hypothetical protein